ncbi:MAG: baeRF11 domain-containing protein [Solirubrobacteraceae bacterium]
MIEVSPDLEPTEVTLPDMPQDAASAAGRASLGDRAPIRRIQGDEGRKLRLRQYARKVDQALRPFLSGLDVPLILAAGEPLDSIYAGELRATQELFERRRSEGRGLIDVGDVARAATFGAVDTLLIAIDQVVSGSVDEETGAVPLTDAPTAAGYGVVDEIARRSWLWGATVLAVRKRGDPRRRLGRSDPSLSDLSFWIRVDLDACRGLPTLRRCVTGFR